jgi:hypothetical protein
MVAVYPDAEFILVGGKPNWYNGHHIEHIDYERVNKEQNIRDKVIAGSMGTSKFLFANDDHILLAPITETYHKGKLSETIKGRNPSGSYTRLLLNTMQHYDDVDNVDTHCPMWMDSEALQRTNFEWPLFGLGFKTCYAQENGITSVFMQDCKVSTIPTGRQWWSMTDDFDTRKLSSIYQQPSKFEL